MVSSTIKPPKRYWLRGILARILALISVRLLGETKYKERKRESSSRANWTHWHRQKIPPIFRYQSLHFWEHHLDSRSPSDPMLRKVLWIHNNGPLCLTLQSWVRWCLLHNGLLERQSQQSKWRTSRAQISEPRRGRIGRYQRRFIWGLRCQLRWLGIRRDRVSRAQRANSSVCGFRDQNFELVPYSLYKLQWRGQFALSRKNIFRNVESQKRRGKSGDAKTSQSSLKKCEIFEAG